MKSITFFIHTLGGGGAEKVLVDLINNMDHDKYKITLQPLINTGSLLDSVNPQISVKPIFKVPSFIIKKKTTETGTLIKGTDGKLSFTSKIYMLVWAYFSKVIYLLFKKRVVHSDVMVAFLEGPTQIFVSNIKTNGKKVSWVHVDLSVETKSESFFRNYKHISDVYGKYDDIVAVSKDVKNSLSKYDIDTTNVKVIYNIYNDMNIRSKGNLDLPSDVEKYFDDRINVISVGRLSNQKGYDRLINALQIFKEKSFEKYSRLNVLIVGTGENEESLEKQIQEQDVASAIKLIGFHSNPYQLINKADCFISSSRTEGYSTVVVESVILGVPVFTTDCSGMAEILNDGEIGFIKDNSVDGILELLNMITEINFESDDVKNKISLGVNKYSMKDSVKKVEKYFDEI